MNAAPLSRLNDQVAFYLSQRPAKSNRFVKKPLGFAPNTGAFWGAALWGSAAFGDDAMWYT